MTIREQIKNLISKLFGSQKIPENPNDPRMMFISHDDEIKHEEIRANKVWFIGNGDELLNYYTGANVSGFNDNPIYNRNKRNYFWSQSADECKIKRVHSGIPYAIISTLSNIIGMPQIKLESEEEQSIWDKIAKENEFSTKLTQWSRPLTMAEGYGAYKVNVSKISNFPIIEYYEAEDVEYIIKSGMMFGIIFKSYYKDDKGKDFTLIETRYRKDGNSYVQYQLYKLNKADEVVPCELKCIPELENLQNIVIKGYDRILAVPSRYFYDIRNPKYGRSIYAGKLDLFDMLDEIWSQASATNRVSSPVEYYNPEILDRTPNGGIGVPSSYNRQYVMKAGIPNGEGELNQDIVTTQPDLNFDKYGGLIRDVLDCILTGVLSPATLGIEVAKKDNAEAQREKEKISIMTRNNIICAETNIVETLVSICLDLYNAFNKGSINLEKNEYGVAPINHKISIKYDEFANPSFENELQLLGGALANNVISPKKFVDLLWGESISEEEKQAELQYIEQAKQSENFDLNNLLNERTDKPNNSEERENPIAMEEAEE